MRRRRSSAVSIVAMHRRLVKEEWPSYLSLARSWAVVSRWREEQSEGKAKSYWERPDLLDFWFSTEVKIR